MCVLFPQKPCLLHEVPEGPPNTITATAGIDTTKTTSTMMTPMPTPTPRRKTTVKQEMPNHQTHQILNLGSTTLAHRRKRLNS